MKQKKPVEPPGDVPTWFMTYSDVITLMMTFFILLLTFATNEPERFEQMKISVFGASAANGLVGPRADGVEKDSWLVRVRNRASRLLDRGSDMPPIDKEAPSEAMDKGLMALDDDENTEFVETFSIVLKGASVGTAEGELYDYGIHSLDMIANMMRKRDYELTVEVNREYQLPRALGCIQHLYHVEKVQPDRLKVCRDRFPDLDIDSIRLTLRHFELTSRGQAPKKAAK